MHAYKHWIENGMQVKIDVQVIKNSQAPYDGFEWESYLTIESRFT